jgi:uncharacterized protein (UPF0332 family)
MATKEQHDQWGEGAYLRGVLAVGLADARDTAVADRMQLASRFLSAARVAYAADQYRDAISRSYYAAYHAFRAASFRATGGDDHEKHSELPKHLPEELPDAAVLKNGLTAARYARNRADYEPYPENESAWKAEADATMAFGQAALRDVKEYLTNA